MAAASIASAGCSRTRGRVFSRKRLRPRRRCQSHHAPGRSPHEVLLGYPGAARSQFLGPPRPGARLPRSQWIRQVHNGPAADRPARGDERPRPVQRHVHPHATHRIPARARLRAGGGARLLVPHGPEFLAGAAFVASVAAAAVLLRRAREREYSLAPRMLSFDEGEADAAVTLELGAIPWPAGPRPAEFRNRLIRGELEPSLQTDAGEGMGGDDVWAYLRGFCSASS